MFNKAKLMALISSFGLSLGKLESSAPSPHQMPHGKVGKGQLRMAKPKPSGVAQMKRDAKKRNNIRKRSKH